MIPEPATGLEVKFSLPHLAAMTILGRSTASIDDADAGRRRGRGAPLTGAA